MLSLDIINEIKENLSRINSNSVIKFSLRYQDNTIYVYMKNSQLTTNYCRIDYEDDNDYLFVRFYDFALSQYDLNCFRIRKDALTSDLELLLNINR